MKKKILLCLVSLMIGVVSLTPAPVMAMCGTGHAFFGLKSWYHYLDCNADGTIAESTFAGDNLVEAVWKIVAVVISDLFFVAGMLAVVMIIVAGIKFITSAGDPAGVAKAKKGLTAAIVGLVIALAAWAIVNTVMALWS
ncbi:hypothetical protein IJ095_00880 [Candidatus Saccharibacteria bacterium]|nr:hypothetical protein [Candidatus Saccharibacteria bacterium]